VNELLLKARRSARRRSVITTAVLAVVVLFAAYGVGVAWVQSLLLATAVTAIGAIHLAVSDLEDEPSLPPVDDSGRNVGTRRDVSRLSWVMGGQDNRVGSVPYRRLRLIAANRLALLGLDLTLPADQRAAQDLLGPVAYATLVEESVSAPTQRVFDDCVTRLERLDLTQPVPHPGWGSPATPPATTTSRSQPS
jgi:hypothetical protein